MKGVETGRSSGSEPRVEAHDDLMIDVCFRRARGERGVMRDVHAPRLRTAGVDVQLLTVGGDMQMFAGDYEVDPLGEAMRVIDAFWEEHAEAEGVVRAVLKRDDVVRDEKSLGCLLHIEGAAPFGRSLELVRTFVRLGVRSVGLTWNGGNAVGDGCFEPRQGGLTAFGAELLAELERLGVVIDVSHAGDRLLDDVLATTTKPFMASHSNARALCDHPRNLTDRHLSEIARRGGVIGVVFYPPLVTSEEPQTIHHVVRQVRYIADLVGVEHVGIGPDFLDTIDPSVWEGATFHAIADQLRRPFPSGLESVAQLPALASELARSGFSDAEVELVMGGSFARLFRDVLPG